MNLADLLDQLGVGDLAGGGNVLLALVVGGAGDLEHVAAVEITIGPVGNERVIARHGPGNFLGELNLLAGLRVFVSARVTEPGEVIVVPVVEFRRMVATQPALSDTILGAFIARRAVLVTDAATAIRVIGSRFSPETARIREFLARGGIPHEMLDSDRDQDVDTILRDLVVGPDQLPVVIVAGRLPLTISHASTRSRSAERRFEAGEDGETGGVLCLLECHLAGYLAEGSGG